MRRMTDDERDARRPSLDWRAIARGSLVGFVGSLAVIGLIAFLRHKLDGFARSGAETAVSLLIIVAYFAGGYFSADLETRSPAASGAIVGIATALLDWSVSIAVWLVRRPDHFLQGPQREHPGIALLGPLIFGAIFGALGGMWAGRNRSLSRAPDDDTP
jgi:hypothetical protein